MVTLSLLGEQQIQHMIDGWDSFCLECKNQLQMMSIQTGNALMKPGRAGYELKPIYDCLQLVVLSVIPSAEHKCYPHENCRLIPQNCDRKGNNLSCQ